MAKPNEQQYGGATKLRKVSLVVALSFLTLLAWIVSKRFDLRTVETAGADKSVWTTAQSCRLVLASLTGNQPIDAEIARLQKQALNETGRPAALERLGWIFVRKARTTFDPGFYKLAEQSATCMEANGSSGADALLLRAHALQSLHRFSEAEATARELVKVRERPFDYGVLGDVLIDEGKIREGAAAYQMMVDLRPDLQSYVRAAYVRWLTGDVDGAIQLMRLAVTSSSPNDPESGAWAFTRLALYQLQRSATNQGLVSCDAALSLQKDYAPALMARGRILLTLNRPADAVSDLRRAAELNPLPEYLWALADALRAAGDLGAAKNIESQIIERGAAEDPRSFSLYLATHSEQLDRAVELAERELANRQDIFTHDALAWALAAAGRPTEAQVHTKQALSEGTRDARLYFHAGVIAALSGETAQARQWLQQAAPMRDTLLPSEQAQFEAWRAKILSPEWNSNGGKAARQLVPVPGPTETGSSRKVLS